MTESIFERLKTIVKRSNALHIHEAGGGYVIASAEGNDQLFTYHKISSRDFNTLERFFLSNGYTASPFFEFERDSDKKELLIRQLNQRIAKLIIKNLVSSIISTGIVLLGTASNALAPTLMNSNTQLADHVALQVEGNGKAVDLGKFGIYAISAEEIIAYRRNISNEIAKTYHGETEINGETTNRSGDIFKIDLKGQEFLAIENSFYRLFDASFNDSYLKQKPNWNISDREKYERMVASSVQEALRENGYQYTINDNSTPKNLKDIKEQNGNFDCAQFATFNTIFAKKTKIE